MDRNLRRLEPVRRLLIGTVVVLIACIALLILIDFVPVIMP
jgi:hypothetical protein